MTYPGNPYSASPYQSRTVPTYLFWSVLSAFLFPISGVFAVWASTRVVEALGAGDMNAAQMYSSRAKTLMIVSFVLFVVMIPVSWMMQNAWGMLAGSGSFDSSVQSY
ncbi:CD225/dispanin family protein [Corynebacterium aquilae]|uniref:Interferon-induced transmembrane protein n=1 Tax=Corynebacterium aquilae DSM 44791 TaxID=1431546 RepID=A0A1L7CI50_9CORY|nr:CD225/dispanin family protein [Corynebacterium aquilae]APT85531.1 hypothetical protein CAQU_11275 [Corynebacterium aquilae DSM 44791]